MSKGSNRRKEEHSFSNGQTCYKDMIIRLSIYIFLQGISATAWTVEEFDVVFVGNHKTNRLQTLA